MNKREVRHREFLICEVRGQAKCLNNLFLNIQMILETLRNLFASGYIGEDENGEYYDPKLALQEIEVEIEDPEVQVLIEEEFGGVLPTCGNIEIELHRLLEILPRKRRKADAYKGLVSRLRNNYGLELVIVSARKKKGCKK